MTVLSPVCFRLVTYRYVNLSGSSEDLVRLTGT